jgi:hypothetical protein
LNTRFVEGGFFASFSAGRRGRATSSPPQLGQRPPSTPSAHFTQNVHSKEQILASVESAGRSMSQHSQPGRSSSMVVSLMFGRQAYARLAANVARAPDRKRTDSDIESAAGKRVPQDMITNICCRCADATPGAALHWRR